MTPMTGSIALLVYGVLLLIGGVMGKVSAGSNISLIAGGAFGVLAIVSAAIITYGSNRVGLIMGGVVALLVMGSMGDRFIKTGKFMPSGMTAILSLFVLVLIAVIFLRQSPKSPVREPGVTIEDLD